MGQLCECSFMYFVVAYMGNCMTDVYSTSDVNITL